MNRREPFAIEACVTYSGTWGNHAIRYWHQTPCYWRAERDGQIILMSSDDGWVYHDEAWPIQMLGTPPLVCRLAGAGSLPPDGEPVTMLGRAAMRYDLDPDGTMTVDAATGFVLEVHADSHLVTEAFTVPDAIDPAVFGETALNTSWKGFYSGYLLSDAQPRDGGSGRA